GDEHGEEVGEALGVGLAGEVGGALVGAYGLLKPCTRGLLVREGDERVLDVLKRLKHGRLVPCEELLLRRGLQLDVAADPTAREDRPGHARADGEGATLPVEEVRGADALETRG